MSRRALLVALFVPTFLFALGEGAIIPLIPVVAERLGADLSMAGVVAAMIMTGQLVGDIPAGALVSRLGERWSMIGAALLSVGGLVLCLVAHDWTVLLVGVFVVGLATAVFSLARQTFVTVFVPVEIRARSLSTLAGVFRAGLFVGPFLSAGVVSLSGDPQTSFLVHIACCLAAIAVLAVVKDPAPRTGPVMDAAGDGLPGAAKTADTEPLADFAPPRRATLRTLLVEHRGVFARMGLGAAIISGVRSARQVILPLWALSIGLDDATTALVIGIANGVDFALFYISGHIMDKHGRIWVVVPMLVGIGAGFVGLAATHGLSNPFAWFAAFAVMISIASGMGAGIIMTIAADLAPRHDPALFLAVFRLIGDAGNAAAPLAVSATVGLSSIAVATAAVGILGLAGGGLMRRWMPRYLDR